MLVTDKNPKQQGVRVETIVQEPEELILIRN
jgi:hypothetical protein